MRKGPLRSSALFNFPSLRSRRASGSQSMQKKFLVTGGAGFHRLGGRAKADSRHVSSRSRRRQAHLCGKSRFVGSDIARTAAIASSNAISAMASMCGKLLFDYQPDVIMHLAAERHVDRSIDGPAEFVQTNVVGTFTLLQAALVVLAQACRTRGVKQLPLPSCLDRRSLRLFGRRRAFPRGLSVSAEFALFGLEGWLGPSSCAPGITPMVCRP